MKIIFNKFIPFKGFIAINIFGILFVRKEYKNSLREKDINHENIHTQQMKELLFIFFYIWYFVEWVIKFCIFIFKSRLDIPYRSISFEQEAYINEDNFDYIKNRKHYSWVKYIFKKWKR